MAIPYDLDIRQGDTWRLPVTFTSGGSSLDVSAYTFGARIGSYNLPVMSITIATGASNEVTLSLTSSSTAALTLTSTYNWDFQQTVGSTVTTLLYGNVNVAGQVTP